MVLTLLKTLVRGKKIHFQTRTKYTSIRAYLIKSNHYLQPLVFSPHNELFCYHSNICYPEADNQNSNPRNAFILHYFCNVSKNDLTQSFIFCFIVFISSYCLEYCY